MEQLLKLPQIRISQLQKIISQRKGKHSQQKESYRSRLEYPLILGEKAFYASSRKQNTKCFCSHMKCDCKNIRVDQKQISNHKYLNRKRKRDQNALIKCKTQSQQIEYQPFFKYSRNRKRKNQHSNSCVETDLIHVSVQNQVSQLYSKIEKQLREKTFKKYYTQFSNTQVKNQIINYLTQFYMNKWRKQKQNIIDVRKDYKMIIKQIQKLLKSKQKKQNGKKQKSRKMITESTSKKSMRNIKSTKNIKNLRTNKQTVKAQNQAKQIKEKKDKFEEAQKNKEPQLEYEILVDALIGTASQTLTDQFFTSLINADMKQFVSKLNQIQQIIVQYEGKGRIKKIIMGNINKLVEKIQQSNLSYKAKQQKSRAIQKILRFTGSDRFEQQQIKNLYAMYKERSRKTIKKTKTTKSFRKFEGDQDSEYQLEEASGKVSSLSLADGLQITQYCQQQIGKPIQNYNKLQKKSSKRSSCISIRLNQNIEQTDEINENERPDYQNIWKTNETHVKLGANRLMNNEDQYKTDRKKRTVFDTNLNKIRKGRTERRFLTIKQDEILSNQQQPAVIVESDEHESQNIIYEQQTLSRFKREHENQAKILKQKTKINKKMIEKFMAQNKKIVQKSVFHLKKQKMEGFIIENTDSVLLKKKKLRKLKSLVTTLKQLKKNEIVQELLNYIDCYQIECKLIMNMNKANIRSQYIKTEKDHTRLQDLVDKSRIDQNLKFIRLSQDYHYGQQQDNQLDYMGPFNIIQERSYVQKPQINTYDRHAYSRNALHTRYGNLMQVDLPELGHLQSTAITRKQEIFTETKITNNENKLYKRIRKYIEQKKQETQKFIRSNKFLLTQNTMSVLSDTSRINFSET